MLGYAEGIWPTPGYTYASFTTKGFAVWDTSNLAAPRLIVNVPVIGGVDSVITKGNYLYVGAHNDGVWVLDIQDPRNPVEVAFVKYYGRTGDLSISGNYLYTAGEWAKVCIIDISNPTIPRLVRTNFRPPGDNSDINNVLADGNYLYTTLGVVDITHPESPVYISRVSFDGNMATYGDNYLLVATGNGIRIYDVSVKTNPRLISTYGTGTAFVDISVTGLKVLALSERAIISSLDMSNPNSPVLLDSIPYSGWTGYSLSSSPTYTYASGSNQKAIKMINISDARNLVTSYEVSLPVTDPYECIWYDGTYVYTGGRNGAYILATNDFGQTSNRAPVLAMIGNKTVSTGSLLTFTIRAADPDDNSLAYSASNLPANATFNPATRTFAWTPTAAQAGTYTVTFMVTDGSLSDTESVRITANAKADQQSPVSVPVVIVALFGLTVYATRFRRG
jgi:hypothetical protein